MAEQVKNATLRIRQVGDKDLKNIVRGLDKVERRTKSIQTNLIGLRRVFFAVFGGLGIRELFNAADSVQLLEDRIKVFTGSAEEASNTLLDLFDAADITNTSVESLAETFNRVALATKELGLSTEELVGFTATLQNTFRLSGASIAESAGAAIQLSQGLASGQLRGQELRSVLESNAVIGQILADTLKTTRGQLIKFAESGQITSDVVINALSKNAAKLNEDAQKLGQTFGQTLIKAFDRVKLAINDVNKRFKLNENFAKGIQFITERIENLAAAFLVVLVPSIVAGLNAIKVAVATNPVGLVVTALASIIFFAKDIGKALAEAFIEFDNFITKLLIKTNKFFIDLGKSDNRILKALFGGKSSIDSANKTIDDYTNRLVKNAKNLRRVRREYDGLNKTTKDVITPFANLKKINLPKTINNTADALKILNFKLNEGLITIKEYNREFLKLQEQDLDKRFKDGAISISEYNEQLLKLRDLNEGFRDQVFDALTISATRYSQQIGSVTSQLVKVFDDTFARLEDVIFNTLKKGRLQFEDFAQFIADELLRIQIRTQIISPLVGQSSQLFNLLSGGAQQEAEASVAGFAKGGVFNKGNQVAFASGGIIGSPTLFPMGSSTGVMGEKGPEAIVPLTRTSTGDLGVKANPSNVTVNVNNQAGVEVDVQSTQLGNDSVLEVTITKAINRAINTGRLDRTLNNNFGLNRKGNR